MPRAAWLDRGRMRFHVHVNRPREPELPILQDDGVAVLRDAIDWAVERPVEDDARRLATHARVVLVEEHGKLFSTLLACRCELGALNHPRAFATGARWTADPPF